ncbi:DUF2742 domain-containing protein [Aeromicrobium wangtongii]|uniref:DUF2742 domain-containing protein n=1 Tax=Aeromicrobium wangtongii TaxID=2969247 RepID=UPI002017CF9B|nr:DUF2742 domain-containing protein [Aeromicrobium wangtongii]MCL3818546.1 DUF2742 domain-containing protein [Aeromicrobium wangtongii]
MINEKSRPAQAASPTFESDPTVQPIGHSRFSAARRRWAWAFISRATPTRPAYGSPAWLSLPDGHPNKIAAVVVAAEIWARRADDLEAELRRDLAMDRQAFKKAEDAEYVANWRAHQAWVSSTLGTNVTSFQDRRARQLDAARPRPGDFPGRSGGGDLA